MADSIAATSSHYRQNTIFPWIYIFICIFPWIFPHFQTNLEELPEKKCVHIHKGETSRYSIYHFLMNGFWQTSSRWSLPFWRSITLASHRICVARVRAISMAPTLSERTAHPWNQSQFCITGYELHPYSKLTSKQSLHQKYHGHNL